MSAPKPRYAQKAPECTVSDRGLLLCLYILDRVSGEHRPLVPGLFERALNQHRFPAFAGNATGPLAPLETEQ